MNSVWHPSTNKNDFLLFGRPVSKQVLIPNATTQITAEGDPQGDHAGGIAKGMIAMLEQLQWWAEACKRQRAQQAKK